MHSQNSDFILNIRAHVLLMFKTVRGAFDVKKNQTSETTFKLSVF